MIAFGHTAVGSIVGLTSYHFLGNQDPVTSLIITGSCGVLSHYIADFLPHGHFFKAKDYKKYLSQILLFDFLLSLVVFISAAFYNTQGDLKFLYILFGIGGSQLPDILDGLLYIKALPNKGLFKLENNLHRATHWHGVDDKALMWSIFDIWQVLVVLISSFLIIYIK